MADIKTWKKDFLASRKKEDESPTTIAQRFINIYRQLPILGEEAVKRYNALLMEQATAEVLIALTSLPGGEEIREYINFLEHKDLEEREELEAQEKQTAELPKAEELSPLWETMGTSFGSHMNMAQTAVKDVARTVISMGQKDLEKLKQQVLSLVHQQNEETAHILKFIIVDSDIDKMQQTLNQAIEKITLMQQSNEHILDSLFNQAGPGLIPSQEKAATDEEQAIEKEQNSSKKAGSPKPVFTAAAKNKRMHPIPKYSVDLIEEEDT
mgnify:CR=1 FL=1